MLLEKLGLERSCTLNFLLNRVQPYINYEEKLLVEEKTLGKRNLGYNLNLEKDSDCHRDDGDRGPHIIL